MVIAPTACYLRTKGNNVFPCAFTTFILFPLLPFSPHVSTGSSISVLPLLNTHPICSYSSPSLFFFFLCLLCISPFSNFPPSLISCPLIRSRSPSLFPFRFISFAVHRIVKNDASDEQKNNTQPVKHVIISLSVNISMCWDFYFCLVVNLKKLKYKE